MNLECYDIYFSDSDQTDNIPIPLKSQTDGAEFMATLESYTFNFSDSTINYMMDGIECY